MIRSVADVANEAKEQSTALASEICGCAISKEKGEEPWAEDLAARLGVRVEKLHGFASVAMPHVPRLDLFVRILTEAPEHARQRALARLAEHFGFAIVPFSDAESAGIEDVLNDFLATNKAAGDVGAAIASTMSERGDGGERITVAEAEHMVERVRALSSAAVRLLTQAAGLKSVVSS